MEREEVVAGVTTVAPVRTKPLGILKIPKMITNTAEKVVKCLWNEPFEKLERAPIDIKAGKVPKENANIVSPPVKKSPLPNTYNCKACVKPQGRKKVPAPNKKAFFIS